MSKWFELYNRYDGVVPDPPVGEELVHRRREVMLVHVLNIIREMQNSGAEPSRLEGMDCWVRALRRELFT